MSLLTRIFVSCLLVVVPLSAQDSRAKVQGTIADSSGAIIVGANVTLTNDETGIRVAQVTGATGVYLFDFVLPSTYTMQVEMTGFRTFVQKNILVQLAATLPWTRDWNWATRETW